MKRQRHNLQPPAQNVALPQLTAALSDAPRPARRNYSKWRVLSLLTVHLLIALHIAHWKISGRTLAPLELNEVMYTLEAGIITAGFIFMALIVVSVMVFGRFFCSWGCHILALQDLCAWILRKCHIRAKPVRSRVLLLVGPAAMFYMFLWPALERMVIQQDHAALPLRVTDDSSGWASFVTDDFWRNLPGPGIALLTFAVCGFLIVYILGTRSFCRYACPYGAVFSIMDRIAPGRIKVDPDKCTNCGVCTTVCESHVRVHEELLEYGRVVDSQCLKDLDCVSVCPEQALSYGWSKPSWTDSLRPGRRRLRYDFSIREELLIVVVFLLCLVTFRGLYGIVPFLLSLAISGILAYVAVLTVRLVTAANARLNRFQLKYKGSLTRTGLAFSCCAALLWLFVLHSGVMRVQEVLGQRAMASVTALQASGADRESIAAVAENALKYYQRHERWGLLSLPGIDSRIASLHWATGDVAAAESRWRRAIEHAPDDHEARLDLAVSLSRRGEVEQATSLLRQVVSVQPERRKDAHLVAGWRADAWYELGAIAALENRPTAAMKMYRMALGENPGNRKAQMALIEHMLSRGESDEARRLLRSLLETRPRDGLLHYNLAVLDTNAGDHQQAITHYRKAVAIHPHEPDIWNNLGLSLAETDQVDQAIQSFKRAIELQPRHARSHFNLGRLLLRLKQEKAARWHLQEAAKLDQRYQQLLQEIVRQ